MVNEQEEKEEAKRQADNFRQVKETKNQAANSCFGGSGATGKTFPPLSLQQYLSPRGKM